ncbi:MAG TPA: hypothetical protein VJO14_02420, partial [Bacteroidota bacterium]|nr:hypothetical protein [Bacteroidota bacterium]
MIRIRQTRRNFLRTAGGLAIVGLFDPARTVSEAWSSTSAGTAGPSRIAVFFEEGFPGIDHFHLDRAVLGEALRGIGTPDIIGVDFLTSAQLGTGIDRSSYRLFVNPYGSAFPLEAWGAIRQFLSTGGNLLNLGGAPFSVAVNRRPDGTWEHGYPRTTYHRELGITQSFRVAASRIPDGPVSRYVDLSGDPDGKGLADLIRVDEACELYVRFTSTRDYPGEDGTAGQRDAQIRAEVGGFDAAGDLIVAPVVRIDRLLGEFSGGRWILANFTGSLTPAAVGNLAGRALGPVVHPSVEPTFATYLQGETPAFALRTPDPSRGFSGRMAGAWSVMLSDAAGKTIFRTTFRDDPPGGRYVLPRETARKLAPGLHTVGCTFTPADGKQSGSERITAENGFWIMDGKLLSSGRGLTAGERYFSHGDIPYPVVGTSYMSEGVQRKFLFEPNPVLWDRDFREMKRSGINLIRTGIWTGWKNIMLDAGRLDETVLRALDAFVLTAARYDIPVVFTFFSFLPESWGGENPYLDPRAV